MHPHGINLSVRKQILKCYTRGQESIICIVYFVPEEFTSFILWAGHLFKDYYRYVCSFSDHSCSISKLVFSMVLMYEVSFYCKLPNFYRKNNRIAEDEKHVKVSEGLSTHSHITVLLATIVQPE